MRLIAFGTSGLIGDVETRPESAVFTVSPRGELDDHRRSFPPHGTDGTTDLFCEKGDELQAKAGGVSKIDRVGQPLAVISYNQYPTT